MEFRSLRRLHPQTTQTPRQLPLLKKNRTRHLRPRLLRPLPRPLLPHHHLPKRLPHHHPRPPHRNPHRKTHSLPLPKRLLQIQNHPRPPHQPHHHRLRPILRPLQTLPHPIHHLLDLHLDQRQPSPPQNDPSHRFRESHLHLSLHRLHPLRPRQLQSHLSTTHPRTRSLVFLPRSLHRRRRPWQRHCLWRREQ